ncbi:MAG: DEAD/DEAH box helicase [Nevskiales bacterium]|nr:DEAD/DEAH box helicase [Nevskiales bacterium]
MADTPLLALLAGSNWPHLFDRKTLRAGSDFARQRRVADLSIDGLDPTRLHIGGRVAAAGDTSFNSTAEVRREPGGRFEIDLHCNCPDGGPCPHNVAVLLSAVQRNTDPVPLILEHPVLAARAPAATRTQPQPILRLRSERFGARSHRAAQPRIGVARLCFDYDGQRLPPDGRAQSRITLDDERTLTIDRLRGFEGDVVDQLGEFHLMPAETVVGIYLDDEDISRFATGDYVLERGEGRPASPAHLAKVLPRLAAAGFALEFEEDFPVELLQEPDAWHLDVRDRGDAWFDVSLGIDVAGERIDLLPVLRGLLTDPAFPHAPLPNERDDTVWLTAIDERRKVPLPLKRLRALIEPLVEWLSRPIEHDGGADPDAQTVLPLRLPQAAVLDELPIPLAGGEALRERLQALDAERAPARPAEGFRAELRPYQQQGLAWLGFLADAGLGGILADDMGLGKTVQVLAHIWTERARGRLRKPALIVVPTSLIANWRNEARRFAPELRTLVLHGPDRRELYAQLKLHDLLITTYPLLARDHKLLKPHRFGLLVLDEAQTIKNARTQAAQVVRGIRAERRLAVTGTPLENHLGELWAQLDAVEPGLLGNERAFNTLYRTPIEKHGNAARLQRLHRRIAPLILRRRKEDVAPELPPRTEILRSIDLEGDQRDLYETLRLAQEARVQSAIHQHGLGQSGMVVLDALLKLRQACCDPRLVKLDGAQAVRGSAKLDHLLELLEELIAEDRRVLVFSQFTEMLDLISAALRARQIEHLLLTGATKDRGTLVDRFQNGDVPVFLISLKAGGVGLNLTAADTVIHYDPWWNPAAEAQASDRAHRIGQDKPVFIYKLICSGSVEEKIQAMQTHKSALAQAILEGGTSNSPSFTQDELAELLAPL